MQSTKSKLASGFFAYSLKAQVPILIVLPMLIGIAASWWLSHMSIRANWEAREQGTIQLIGSELLVMLEEHTRPLSEAALALEIRDDRASRAAAWSKVLEANPKFYSVAMINPQGLIEGVSRTRDGVQAFVGVEPGFCSVWRPGGSAAASVQRCALDERPARGLFVGVLLGERLILDQAPVAARASDDLATHTVVVGMRRADLEDDLEILRLAADGARIIFIDPSANLMASLGSWGEQGISGAAFAEVLSAVEHREFGNSVVDMNMDGDLFRVGVASPVSVNRDGTWQVLVLIPSSAVGSLGDPSTRQTIALALVAVLMASWFGVRVSRTITHPVISLAEYASELRAGRHHPEVVQGIAQRSDEFGALANAFGEMADVLLARQGELEELVRDRTLNLRVQSDALLKKHQETEQLLLNILPPSIIHRLQEGESKLVDVLPEVTIIFCDLVGFTRLSAQLPAEQLIHVLNTLFSEFDRLTLELGVEKIKTIGDAYMAVAGLPEPRADHAVAAMELSLAMQEVVAAFNKQTGRDLSIRIGLNSGPVTAGIIGTHKFAYDIWGDAVNTASRMESSGVPGTIQVSEATRALLGGKYLFDDRGEIPIKGKGTMRTYLFAGRSDEESASPPLEPAPPVDMPSWGSLLNKSVSVESIRAFLTRDLFAEENTTDIVRFAGEELTSEHSWSEILRAPASIRSLKILLTKNVGGDQDEHS